MTAANRWSQILKNTERPPLNERSRFWRSLAFIRLGKIEEAESCLNAGKFPWQDQARQGILCAEIHAARQEWQSAQQIMLSILHLCANNELQESWQIFAKRWRHQLPLLLEEVKQLESIAPSIHSQEEWLRWLSLPENQNSKSVYYYLEWNFSHGEMEVFPSIIETWLKHSPDLYQLMQGWKKTIEVMNWQTAIAYLFWPICKKTLHLDNCWQRLHRECPRESRPFLRNSMAEYLKKYPDTHAEIFLESVSVLERRERDVNT